jgi:hypothetical protein
MKTNLQKPLGRWTAIFTGLIWAIVYFIARWLLDNYQLTEGVRVVLALIPIIPFGFFLVLILIGIRQMDELHRQVRLEALAIAFPLAMLLLMILGLLELAIPLSPDDWSYRHVWYYLPIFYLLGMWIARRRYQ